MALLFFSFKIWEQVFMKPCVVVVISRSVLALESFTFQQFSTAW